MQVYRRIGPGGRASRPGCVATIGVFDGLHRGHLEVLRQVRAEAARLGLPSLVFSFEPVPAEVLESRVPPARLMRFREKAEALSGFGIDRFYCPPFDQSLATLSPADFIERLLVATLGVRGLVIGDDFRFGHRRAGSFADLEAGGRRFGFSVARVAGVELDGGRVSSTAVRAALAAGELDRAAALLGRPYAMSGRVVGGQRLGRELGFPTANIRVGRRRCPLDGIFAVRVHGVGPAPVAGVASLGTRPTVAGQEPLLEVHVFDYSGDLYGRRLTIDFIARLRSEARFPDLEALRRQMELDAAEARRVLAA
jgi:riboflavin kinase/FMN adenylyltransferase